MNWATVYQVDKEDLLKPYESGFSEGMGTLKGMKAKFYVDDTVKPRFFKPRHVETSNFFQYLSKSKINCSQNYLSKSKSSW